MTAVITWPTLYCRLTQPFSPISPEPISELRVPHTALSVTSEEQFPGHIVDLYSFALPETRKAIQLLVS